LRLYSDSASLTAAELTDIPAKSTYYSIAGDIQVVNKPSACSGVSFTTAFHPITFQAGSVSTISPLSQKYSEAPFVASETPRPEPTSV
jgi:hypothetical protein